MTNVELVLTLVPIELWNTLRMVFVSAFFAFLFGLPLGVFLMLTDQGQIKESLKLYRFLETLVNIGRSFPFAVLMVATIPFTRVIVGTSLGTTASMVPLTLAAIPFVARLVEINLKELDRNILEAVIVMGSNTWQIITKVLLKEALPTLISSATLTLVTLIDYSAMAGLVGGGGLGQIAIQYGYQRFNTFIMVTTVILLIVLVQLIQWTGRKFSQSILKKRGLL